MPQSACPIEDTLQAPLPKWPSYSFLSAMWHAGCDYCHAPAQAVVTACHSLSGSPWQSPIEVSATMPSVQGGVLGKNEPLGNYPLEQILSSRWVRGSTSQAPRPSLATRQPLAGLLPAQSYPTKIRYKFWHVNLFFLFIVFSLLIF